jgi:O-antigen/teichoic acid export membrane protein
MLKINLTANFIGQLFSTGIGFVFIPIYIKYIGVESYGLIGIFGIITAWMGILDAGLISALGREMALYSAGKHSPHSIRTLLKSVEGVICIGVGLFLIVLILGVDFLSSRWIQSKFITREVKNTSMLLMGILFSLKFFESIYKSSIVGLQKQVLMNGSEAIYAFIKSVGAVLVLKYVSNSILVFFYWQVGISITYIICLKFLLFKQIPISNTSIKFSMQSVLSLKSFAGGMLVMTILNSLLTQIDKIFLIKFLTLEEFGYYSIATAAAGAIMIVTSPVSSAFLPRLIQLNSLNNKQQMLEIYRIGFQIIAVLLGSISAILFFFPETFLLFWTNNIGLTLNVKYVFAITVIGYLISGLNTMPFVIQLSVGSTKVGVWIRIISVLFSLPLMYYFIPIYGKVAAAYIWLAIALINLVISFIYAFSRVFVDFKYKIFWSDLFQILFVTFIISFLMSSAFTVPNNRIMIGIYLLLFFSVTLFFSICSANLIRKYIYVTVKSFFKGAIWS